jgi:hypothetical protein
MTNVALFTPGGMPQPVKNCGKLGISSEELEIFEDNRMTTSRAKGKEAVEKIVTWRPVCRDGSSV